MKKQIQKDYLWNTLGSIAFAFSFPIMTIIVTHLQGEEIAGMFSVAFITAQMFMIVGNYAVKVYQVSDTENKYSFFDYQVQRFLTCIMMISLNLFYNFVKGYRDKLLLISFLICLYKAVDALADVYEGELQKSGLLYIAGKSLFWRTVISVIAFSVSLVLSNNLIMSIVVALITSCIFLIILAILPIKRSLKYENHKWNSQKVISIFIQCFPLFLSVFLVNYINNSPKYAMEGVLEYKYQTYFNALYFPAQTINTLTSFIFKPMLTVMAEYWNGEEKDKLKKFVNRIVKLIVCFQILGMIGIYLLGIPILEFVFGVNLVEYRYHAVWMIAAGGIIAIVNFLYNVLVVMRKQKRFVLVYIITFVFALLIPRFLVERWYMWGSCLSYFILVSILLIGMELILNNTWKKTKFEQ